MLDIFDFIDNYKELAGKLHPPVTAKEVRESIVLLRELELIRVTEQGYLKPTDKMITTGEYAREALVKQYQLKCLEHAGQALIDERMKDSRFFTQTISVSTTGYHRIMERMQQFKKEIRSIVHKDEQNSDTVCQLSIQLSPQIRL